MQISANTFVISSLICCTWGADGAGAYDGRSGDTVVIPAYRVAQSEIVE
jgi:hypothetical protein